IVVVDQATCIGCGFCTWACPFNAPQLTSMVGKMQKCNFCQTPGKERPLDMPRACEEICPTSAIQSGPLSELAKVNREKAARKLGGSVMQGFPGLMVDAHQRFGPGED
ncbi:MAG: 4Fe-4S binding protein, partial [Methyloligellaceae bacterium]